MIHKKQDQKVDSISNLATAFDSSISPMVPVTKMAIEWEKSFNDFFSFQKLVEYNFINYIQVKWIET